VVAVSYVSHKEMSVNHQFICVDNWDLETMKEGERGIQKLDN
jgi:hypothetical protein